MPNETFSTLDFFFMMSFNVLDKNHCSVISLSLCWSIYKTYISCILHILWNVLQIIRNRQWISLLTGVEGVNTNISYHLCIATFLGLMFGATLIGFTAVHFYYIMKNQTSIEYVANRPVFVRTEFGDDGKDFEIVKMDPKKLYPYNRGPFRNWCIVMGSNPLFWFIPASCNLDYDHQYSLEFCNRVSDLAKSQREISK